jgi:hypothetical protein
MPHPVFARYWDLRVKSATTRLKAALEIITHNPTRGSLAQDVLRSLLAEFLPTQWAAGTGFILNPSNLTSKQIDIILYDRSVTAPVYRDDNIAVVSPDTAKIAIEVKSNLDKKAFKDAVKNAASVKKVDSKVRTLLFAYRSFGKHSTIRTHLRSAVRSARRTDGTIDRTKLPDSIYLFEHDIIADLAPVGAAHTYEVFHAAEPVVKFFFTDVLTSLLLRGLLSFMETGPRGNSILTV